MSEQLSFAKKARSPKTKTNLIQLPASRTQPLAALFLLCCSCAASALVRAPLPYGLKQHNGSGHGHIQGADRARHGNAHQKIALLGNMLVQSLAFRAEDDGAIHIEIDFVIGLVAAFVETDDPDVLGLQFLEHATDILGLDDAY